VAQTPVERAEAGRACRHAASLEAHGEWRPPAGREDPLVILARSNVDRLADLVPIRYGRMLESPLAFLRGSADVMAADLARTPVAGLTVQLCGDAHLGNFGAFATPERNLVFDANDFDETLPGPFEWDVKRLAASVAVAAGEQGAESSATSRAVRRTVRSYRKWMGRQSELGMLDIWYAHIESADVEAALVHVPAHERKRDERRVRRRTSARLLPKLAELTDQGGRIKAHPPLVVPLRGEAHRDEVNEVIATYPDTLPENTRGLLRRHQLADVAQKVVGVGSVGTRCLVALLFGRDTQDPLFLQVKQAEPSALAAHLGPGPHDHQGQRVVEGQRAIQAASDILLGWSSAGGRHYYVRQLRDMKASASLTTLDYKQLVDYSRLCGRALARAHARTGDAIAIAAYLGDDETFDRAITRFAVRYADQIQDDYRRLESATAAGEIDAEPGR